MTTEWRKFQTAIGAVPARPRPRAAKRGSPWVVFRQAVGALPLKSGGGAAWGAFQKTIGAVPVLPSARASRVGVVEKDVVEFCADLIYFGWSSVGSLFAPEETGENEIHMTAEQKDRQNRQLPGKTNFTASTIDIPRWASSV